MLATASKFKALIWHFGKYVLARIPLTLSYLYAKYEATAKAR